MRGCFDLVRGLELAGDAWTVREVHAHAPSGEAVPVLVFDSGRERRTLAPAPPEWARWGDPELRRVLARAVIPQE